MLDPNAVRFFQKFIPFKSLNDYVPAKLDVAVTPEEITAIVELLFARGPLPKILLCMNADGVIDRVGCGAKIVSALRSFTNGFRLSETSSNKLLAGKTLDELQHSARRRVVDSEIIVCVIEPVTATPIVDAIVKTYVMMSS